MRLVGIDSGSYGTRTDRIVPETILTQRNRQRTPDEQKQMLLDLHPIKRLGTPEDVARAALFLASDDAAWMWQVDRLWSHRKRPADPSLRPLPL